MEESLPCSLREKRRSFKREIDRRLISREA